MTERQIEAKVKAAFTSDIPDNFDSILEKCEAQDKIVSMPKERKWNTKYMRRIISTAAVMVIVFTAGIVGHHLTKGTPNIKADNLVGFDAMADDDFFGTTVTPNEQQGNANKGDSDSLGDKNSTDATISVESSVTANNNAVAGKSWTDLLSAMPKKLRGTKLTVYNWAHAYDYTGAPSVIEKFTQQTGITVKWQTIPFDSYFTKIPAVIASGKDIPDIVRARGPIPEYMLSYQPLTTTKFDFSDDVWDQGLMDLYSVNGIPYATNLRNSVIGSVDLMFYNKSIIDKYDLEDPYKLYKMGKWNWEKYLEICREYKNASGNPASCGDNWYSAYSMALGSSGVINFDDVKGKFYNNIKDKDFLAAYKELGDLYNLEKLFTVGQNDAFDSGKCLFAIGTSEQMRRNNSAFSSLKSDNTLCAVPIPVKKGEKRVYSIADAEAYAIAKGASNPEAVPYFLRYFLDSANYNLATFFVNEQNLEVYNICYNAHSKTYISEFPQEIGANDGTGIIGQTGDGVEAYINSKVDAIDKIVAEYNKTIKKIGK